MRTLSYVSGATGESIGFEGPLYGGTLTGLRARIWDYSLASRGTGIVVVYQPNTCQNSLE